MADVPFSLNVGISGMGRVMQLVRNVEDGMVAARPDATRAMAEHVRKRVIENLEKGKSGITWRTPLIPSGWIQYNKPAGVSGSYPASQHGGLVGSIVVKETKAGNASLVAGEGLSRPYAYWLEFGFTTAARFKRSVRFPFMRPSALEVSHELADIAAVEVRKHIR